MEFTRAEREAALELKNKLLDIADDLDDVHKKANKFRMAGNLIGLAGTAALLVATIGSGGIIAPLVVAGAAAAVGGTATSITADIVELVVSKEKLENAQVALGLFRGVLRKSMTGVTQVGEAARALQQVIKNKKALKYLSKVSGHATKLGKMVPVVDNIFLALDIIDILRIILSDGKSEAGNKLRLLARGLEQ